MRVVFIASLVHSGSTLLDLILGGHPRLVGLGELSAMLDTALGNLTRRAEIPCSCGKSLQSCRFWGPVCAEISNGAPETLTERYATLGSHFVRQFGERCALVDSSKTLGSLEHWLAQPRTEVVAIHLIRDVRSWSVSMTDLARRSGEFALGELLRKHGWRGPRRWLGRTTANRFRQWYIQNRRIEQTLSALGVRTFRLGYEELTLRPPQAIEALCSFLDVELHEPMLSLQSSSSHVALGNRMHQQPDKMRAITHDDRWMRRNEWLLPAALFRRVMRYNRERAHGNVRGVSWEK